MKGLFCYFKQTKVVSQDTVRLYTGMLFSFDFPNFNSLATPYFLCFLHGLCQRSIKGHASPKSLFVVPVSLSILSKRITSFRVRCNFTQGLCVKCTVKLLNSRPTTYNFFVIVGLFMYRPRASGAISKITA